MKKSINRRNKGKSSTGLILLGFFVLLLKVYTSTSQGKDELLKVLPSWFEDEVLMRIGNAYSKD